MPSVQIITGVAVIAAFGVLFANNGTQSGRNAIAQADVAHTYPIPAFSQRINQQIADAAQPVAAPQPASAVATPTPAPTPKMAAPVQAHGIDIKAVAVELPNGDREFPAGPGADLVANNCVACHSSGMILNQPSLTKATWTAEVNKMVHTYKAPVADEDVEPIIAYLASMPVAK